MSVQRHQKVDESLNKAKLDDKLSIPASDCYLSLKELSEYSGLSLSSIKSKLRGNGTAALPHFNFGKKILIRKSEFDQWMEENYRVVKPIILGTKAQYITNDICKQLGLLSPYN
ncbi:MAG: helix-turn-helix domain-containing protein [bacterium]